MTCANPALLGLLRCCKKSWTSDFLAVENQYVNDEQRASLLREASQKLIPLVKAPTSDWITIHPYYPKVISPADSTP